MEEVKPALVVFGVELYAREDIQKTLGISVNTLREYMQAGRITPTKLGQNIYFTKEAVQDFLHNRNNGRSNSNPKIGRQDAKQDAAE